MRIGAYEFDAICDIEPIRDTDGSVRLFVPQGRYGNTRNLPLNRYGAGPFCKFKIAARIRASGVYVLTLDGQVRYVGECANLSARFNAGYGNISPKNCFKGGQGRRAHIAVVFPDRRLQVSGSAFAHRPESGLEPDLRGGRAV